MDEAAAQGWNVFFWVMDGTMPQGVKLTLYGIILVAQYICGLATVTSVSRMIFAFARDHGLPASEVLKKVSPRWRVPVAAIWVGAILAVAFVAYADAYSVAVAVTSIALYISYAMPLAAGLFAYGNKWKTMGPWDMGPLFRVVAFLCILIAGFIFYIGTQPPNDKALIFFAGIAVITAVVWFGLEMRRFKGPPVSEADVAARQASITAAEVAVGEVKR
jgi:amino acid transporter